jgi:N-acetylmuramate 1-kinase
MPELPASVLTYLAARGLQDARVLPLTPDASDRRYFRIMPVAGAPFVLAVHAAPFAAGSLPFVNVDQLFAAMRVPVPHILDERPDLGILAQEDLGDLTLQAHLGAIAPDTRDALYREAARLILQIQREGRAHQSPAYLPYSIAFDVDKFTWEMEFFVKHFLGAYRGVALDAPFLDGLRRELGGMVDELAAEPRVLCHRDYHSRNLMVHAGQLFVIDFQDARMGPNTYDLVSLLRDSYVDLPDALVDGIRDDFAAEVDESPVEFRHRFDLMAMQRNLKALGTFGFQAVSKANPVYAQYVPRTLRHVRDNLERNSRFARLRDLLAPLLPELSDAPTTSSVAENL